MPETDPSLTQTESAEDPCQNVLHGGSKVAYGLAVEATLDALIQEITSELRVVLRDPARYAALYANPFHQTVVSVEIAIIDESASGESLAYLLTRQGERFTHTLRYAASVFEKMRRALRAARN